MIVRHRDSMVSFECPNPAAAGQAIADHGPQALLMLAMLPLMKAGLHDTARAEPLRRQDQHFDILLGIDGAIAAAMALEALGKPHHELEPLLIAKLNTSASLNEPPEIFFTQMMKDPAAIFSA